MPHDPPFPMTVAHFAINADDLERARKFYSQAFGWRFEAWGPPGFFMIDAGNGADQRPLGSLQGRRELIPGELITGFECSIAVPDAAAAEARVRAAGGTIIMPRTVIPTVGELFFFRDTEGNVAGAMCYDAAAKAEVTR
jgi:hypothetical protein